jgi:hypothetical protein
MKKELSIPGGNPQNREEIAHAGPVSKASR